MRHLRPLALIALLLATATPAATPAATAGLKLLAEGLTAPIDLSQFIHEGGYVSGFRVGSPGIAGCG